MFGIKYIRFQPNEYVFRYSKGKFIEEGPGLSFRYMTKWASIVVMPAGSIDAPFIFEELSSDFQSVSLQGQIVFRIVNFRQASQVFDYAINAKTLYYLSEDYKKLPQRVVNCVRILAKKRIEQMSLQQALGAGESLAAAILADIQEDREIAYMGIQVLSVSLLDVLANKETTRALEARARELMLQDADDAMYVRRNSSIDQERAVKENEYNTEVSVENKKRQVKEAKLEAESAFQAKRNEMETERLLAEIELERKREELSELAAHNSKVEADAQAYRLSAAMNALKGVDPIIIKALAGIEMKPEQLMASAFSNLAENAEKIGQLNVSPDLLREIMYQEAQPQR
jgi:hypothetical protein